MAAQDPAPITTFLRKVCVGTYPFAFSLGIAHASSASDGLFPAIALVPQTFSTLFSVSILYSDAQRRNHEHAHGSLGVVNLAKKDGSKRLRTFGIFVGDFCALAGLMTCMVFSWLMLGGSTYYYWDGASSTVLGAYATVPFMINMTIHLFFLLSTIYSLVPSAFLSIFAFSTRPSVCPNCSHNLAASEPTTRWAGDRKSGGYSFLHNEESDSLYRDIERQTGQASRDAEDVIGKPKGSEETAREISEVEVAKIVDV